MKEASKIEEGKMVIQICFKHRVKADPVCPECEREKKISELDAQIEKDWEEFTRENPDWNTKPRSEFMEKLLDKKEREADNHIKDKE